MSAFLETMARDSRLRADAAARERPVEAVRESAHSARPPLALGSFGESFDLIAELKPRSPSAGSFPARDPVTAAAGYQSGGAAMLSVLTEPASFGGSLDDLRAISAVSSVPVMAKDFLVDTYQVYQARESGADGILVIARMLSDEAMAELIDAAEEMGMFALLEAFDAEDLRRVTTVAMDRGDVLVGVNCRDLDTLEVVPERHELLAGRLPAGLVAVAESAMGGPEDVERIVGLGYRAALVGSALMRSADSSTLVRSMVDAGRRMAVTT
ncbi:MAG: indole-3-glycerol phosphate synthase TrpC [Acidimicrobiia bacterium]